MVRRSTSLSHVKNRTPIDDQIDLLVDVARAYYEQNHNQDKIAKSLGISRSQVSRYLSRARDMNIVQVRIVAPGERASSLERALKRIFPPLRSPTSCGCLEFSVG
jgi:DNA-binding transcriptional regulator LsrR (DeoR family)